MRARAMSLLAYLDPANGTIVAVATVNNVNADLSVSSPSSRPLPPHLAPSVLVPTHAEAVLLLVSSTLSVFGALLIMASYLLMPQLRSLWRGLLVWLSFYDLVQAAFYISVAVAPNYADLPAGVCSAVAVGNIISSTGAYLTTGCLGYLVHDIIMSPTTAEDPRARSCKSVAMYAVFLGYPVGVAVVALALHSQTGVVVLGTDADQFGCYIVPQYQALRWVASYGPMVLSWVTVVVFHVASYRRLSMVTRSASFATLGGLGAAPAGLGTVEAGGGATAGLLGSHETNTDDGVFDYGTQQQQQQQQQHYQPYPSSPIRRNSSTGGGAAPASIRNVMRRLQLVPLGFFFLRMPDITYRVIELVTTGPMDSQGVGLSLILLQSALNPLQGAWNALLFILFSERVRAQFVDTCCCHGKPNRYNSLNSPLRVQSSVVSSAYGSSSAADATGTLVSGDAFRSSREHVSSLADKEFADSTIEDVGHWQQTE